jgi:hypothetical protein
MTRKSRRKIVLLFALALLSINLAKLLFSSSAMFTGPIYSSEQESSKWLLYNSNKNTTILSDFSTCGLLELGWSTQGDNSSNIRSITSKIYTCMNNSDYSSPECSFIRTSYTLLAISRTTLRNFFYTDNWQLAPPLSSQVLDGFDRIHDGEIIVCVMTNATR